MTKEITKASILQEIQDKLKLREFEPDSFLFSETVVPIYNIEQHLRKWEVRHQVESITSATGFLFYTVPQNERWTLRGYFLLFYAEGPYKVSGTYIKRGAPAEEYIYLDLKKGQTTSYMLNLPQPVVLEAGCGIWVLVDTYVSTADLALRIDVQVEELR